jgi:hypothetical protein
MTARIGSAATRKVVERLTSTTGLEVSLADVSPALTFMFDASHVHEVNVASDLAEKTAGARYPVVNVYCEKIINDQVEKFRTFSGRVQIVAEVRLSQDRLAGLTDTLEIFVDAVGDVLSKNRGDWGDGMYYGGAYEVMFTAVKHGGKNFIQSAKVTFDIGVSKS